MLIFSTLSASEGVYDYTVLKTYIEKKWDDLEVTLDQIAKGAREIGFGWTNAISLLLMEDQS
ncbi:MAG: hypothetical protein ACI9S8_002138 [Chlamydiales bacterium]|jgi:hypothetical protein